MPTWVTSLIGAAVNLPSAVAAAFNAWLQRDKEENTPAMQDNAQAAQDLKLKEKFEADDAAVETKPTAANLDQVRKDGAE